jgi:hypothetical protein
MSVEVTSAGGDRPVVVLADASAALAARLARAGFATVTFDTQGSGYLDVVLDALQRGALGLRAERYGLVERAYDGSTVLTHVAGGKRFPGPTVRDEAAVIQWLTQQLV